ncbi:MAG: SpoIIE family protein phosphatase [Clostridia bacterium]|nr:SpoIIE family protein phosphatase [Clostridia bacterium]
MKDIVKISNQTVKLSSKDIALAVVQHTVLGLCGLFATRAVVMDRLLPFGISFLAGTPLSFTPSVAIGVFLGYIFPVVGNNGFKYAACLFAVLAIKLLLSNYKKVITSDGFITLIAGLCSLMTSAATFKGLGGNSFDIITEMLLTAAGAYFFSRGFLALSKSQAGLNSHELVAVLIMINIIIMGLFGFEIMGVSVGRIFSVLIILIASKYGGIISGAVSGTIVAFTLSIGGIDGDIGVAVALAGLMSGVFASRGKYAQLFIVLGLIFIGAATTGDGILIAITVIECVCGCLIFLFIPRSFGIILGKTFSAYPKVYAGSGAKRSLTLKLNMASHALRDVSETVDKVSLELSKINSPNFSSVINAIEQEACAACKLRLHCWEKRRDDTVNAILEMTKAVKVGELNPEAHTTEEFKGRCLRTSRIGNAVYKYYTEYTSKIAAENRIDEVRSVVSDQFDGISNMLSDLAEDFEIQEQFDNSSAENAAAALKNIGLHIEECSGRVDKFGRMTIEMRLKRTADTVINRAQVMRLCSIACERDFDPPNVSEVGGEIYMVLNEKAEITIDFGAEQYCANGGNLCGDAYKYFYDGKGHFIMILSDGMGTGGRAAVDGAMASGLMARLVKAGFGYNCSLKILNSSMLFKSTDESLATVDIASIDLYTGITELYKAGAAPSILRRSGRTGKAESTSLPAGILRDVSFDTALIKCKIGDIVVLLSDGATSEGCDWLRQEIESFHDGKAQDLAEHLCMCARRRRTDKREDDITVLCAILNKAV